MPVRFLPPAQPTDQTWPDLKEVGECIQRSFPEENPRPGKENLNPDDFVPQQLTATLLAAHHAPHHRCQYHRRLHVPRKVCSCLEDAGGEDWAVILQSDFIQTVAMIAARQQFCGFSKDELTSLKENPDGLTLYKQEYMVLICSIFYMCTRVLIYHSASQFENMGISKDKTYKIINFLLQKATLFWPALWEIKDSFFAIQSKEEMPSGSRAQALYVALIGLGHLCLTLDVVMGLKPGRGMCKPSVRLSHVQFALWINSESPDIMQRYRAVEQFKIIVDRVYGPIHGNRAYREFFEEVDGGCSSLQRAAKTALRDLKSRSDPGSRVVLRNLLRIYKSSWTLPGRSVMPTKAQDRTFVARTLASCHNEICKRENSAAHGEPGPSEGLFEEQCIFMKLAMTKIGDLPEECIHAVVPVLVKVLDDITPLGGRVERVRLETVLKTLSACVAVLEQQRRRGYTEPPGRRPTLDALRRFSAKQWKRVVASFRTMRLNIYPGWQPLIRSWHTFGTMLDVERYNAAAVAEESVAPVFPPLERCGWQDCLCSVHEPVHSLKTCRGCWRIAYCSLRCQKSDWLQGGHRSRCRASEEAS